MECFYSISNEWPPTQAGGNLDSLAEVGVEDEEVEDSGEGRGSPIIINPSSHSSTLNCLLHLSSLHLHRWATSMSRGSLTLFLEDLLMEFRMQQ